MHLFIFATSALSHRLCDKHFRVRSSLGRTVLDKTGHAWNPEISPPVYTKITCTSPSRCIQDAAGHFRETLRKAQNSFSSRDREFEARLIFVCTSQEGLDRSSIFSTLLPKIVAWPLQPKSYMFIHNLTQMLSIVLQLLIIYFFHIFVSHNCKHFSLLIYFLGTNRTQDADEIKYKIRTCVKNIS